MGIGKNARGVVALAIVSKYAVVALKDLNGPDMLLYVSLDARTWARAQFPLSSSAQLRESAYTIVESTIHALAVDVMLHAQATVGTLFVSNSNGTFFVESLKDTNRNELGFVDFENLYGVEGVGLGNIVKNAREVEGLGQDKILQTRITFDDGASHTDSSLSSAKHRCTQEAPGPLSEHPPKIAPETALTALSPNAPSTSTPLPVPPTSAESSLPPPLATLWASAPSAPNSSPTLNAIHSCRPITA